MHIVKYRDATGLVPAGRYFERLAKDLRSANAREHARSASVEAEDHDLEMQYRRASAARTCAPRLAFAR